MSSSKRPDEEKPRPASAPQPPPSQQPASAPAIPAAPRPAAPAVPPRPAVPAARPAAAAPPLPPRPQAPKSLGRRNFVKALVTVGAILSVVPFVPWGSFLSSSLESSGAYQRQKVVVDNNPQYGAAAGKPVNVNDLNTFPPDSHWVVTYPSSGDPTLDAQNPDTFVKFELIRLPGGADFGGDAKDAAAFVAFSKVCVHLWCSPNYNPAPTHEQYECPCHGSIYEIPDGKAKAGPASQQPPPTNAIPMLTLTSDSTGQLFIEVPVWDVNHNGVIGYGRYYESYDAYIKPAAEGQSG